ncbi:MAG: DegT/DnrJ/EryC1/StrS family aminotransferase [Candidatus Omnitrophica bacterium]|nr:DegT/DnrJ/EryC1/StrS family aminotransferase [Candidatus Omnitrophota bacterium]
MKINLEQSKTLISKADYRVPFGTISLTSEAKKLIKEALDRKWLTRGKLVQEFEEKFASLFGVKYAVTVSSGTDADCIALAVLYDYGAKRGDEVIIPALTFIATGNAVLQAGFKPVFVDVKKETLNIDPARIEKAITNKTRAIMPVHLMGKPAEMDKIMAIARRHNLFVVEDAAEAHGAQYKGKYVGTFGQMAAFSLYAAHIVTTIEGGIIITDDKKIAEILRSLRNHGIEGKFRAKRIGFSAKMNEIEAAVGLGNIKIFDKILKKRRRNLLYLIDKFRKFDDIFLSIKEENNEKIGPHAFSIVLKDNSRFTKDEFVAFLDKRGIDSRNLFYSIPTQCPSYSYLGHKLGEFPEAEYCSDNGTHIGIHQDLELKDLDYVEENVEEFLRAKGLR